jgi:SAM-dependent methyltransferase
MSNYLRIVENVYAEAARNPDAQLCCTASPVWRLPDLVIPRMMLEMNYGCGSAVDPRDLQSDDTILYVGVGGGLEALQFAYFARRPGGVIAVDPVAEMREAARRNFVEAARLNPWFRPDFVTLLDGTALALPVHGDSASVIAQNCLFNVFTPDDLRTALGEVVRVLRPGGRFSTSDPITPVPLPAAFADDPHLRARCISGCLTLSEYLRALTDAGLGRVEVRSRVPYRHLHPREYAHLTAPVMLESVQVVAFKLSSGPDGPAIFTGRTATYVGRDDTFDDGNGHSLRRGIPIEVSDAAALRLAEMPEIVVTGPTYHCRGIGCC